MGGEQNANIQEAAMAGMGILHLEDNPLDAEMAAVALAAEFPDLNSHR